MLKTNEPGTCPKCGARVEDVDSTKDSGDCVYYYRVCECGCEWKEAYAVEYEYIDSEVING